MLNQIQKQLLEKLTSLHKIPVGAVAMRVNGKTVKLEGTEDIIISPLKRKKGLNIVVKPNTKNKSLHIPVLIDNNTSEKVYNTFEIGENCDIVIVAGCGIHSTNNTHSSHSGIHKFIVGKNSRVKYVENHLGTGSGAKRDISPTTKIVLQEGSCFEIETTQIGGVTTAKRYTDVLVLDNASIIAKEKILTTHNELASSKFEISLQGENSKAEIISRGVAKNNSKQNIFTEIEAKNKSFGRIECDGIIMDNAEISSTPKVCAKDKNASLSHEAQIGKIDNDALIKLMTMGLTQEEAENQIIAGYLNN